VNSKARRFKSILAIHAVSSRADVYAQAANRLLACGSISRGATLADGSPGRDLAGTDNLQFYQEFLAEMLGVSEPA